SGRRAGADGRATHGPTRRWRVDGASRAATAVSSPGKRDRLSAARSAADPAFRALRALKPDVTTARDTDTFSLRHWSNSALATGPKCRIAATTRDVPECQHTL